MVKTERLILYPADGIQMEQAIDMVQDAGLKKAYEEMLRGCISHPQQWDWYAMWMIERHDGKHVGDLCFKGLSTDGVAEIGYGIEEDYRGQGYATEAVRAAISWAFAHPQVEKIEAEAEADNTASQRVLAKCCFQDSGEVGEEGPRYYRERLGIESMIEVI
ncbi:ribosomal-protein-alanine N-acetyltransferase [Selenomonas sp. GACV-9]|uniref:GNAT family N-acetyltransferase n=1 Tax=Selenomonas sp. GACV-9 TaxID=3158782 RepID=UPI0008E19A85|nr:ribosomal-protein-alanine N-acetyltransferase [Selenomonas ruminantium]